jgi:hypothetical protein
MGYVTLSGLKTYADFQTTNDDSLLLDLITRAESIVESYTGRKFAVSGITVRYFDAIEDVYSSTLYLDEDLAGITVVINGDGTEILSSEYVTEPRNETPIYGLKIKSSSGKHWTYQNDPENAITISGYWGYSTTPPEDIQHAVIRLSSWLYKQRETDINSDRPILTDAGVTIMPAKLPSDVLTILNGYKKLKVK